MIRIAFDWCQVFCIQQIDALKSDAVGELRVFGSAIPKPVKRVTDTREFPCRISVTPSRGSTLSCAGRPGVPLALHSGLYSAAPFRAWMNVP